jgi:NADH-quinone oxidoreductase subunit G
VSWERALDEAGKALARARGRVGAIAGNGATNEEGFLLGRLLREGLDSGHLDSRAGSNVPAELHRALAAPALQASVPDLEWAHAVLVLDCEPVDDAPILDLRLRKGVRRHGVKLAVATSRPSSLDANATLSVRFAPGGGRAFAAALAGALSGDGDPDRLSRAAGAEAGAVRALASLLRDAGHTHGPDGPSGTGDVVVLWGERLVTGGPGADAARALLNLAGALDLTGREGAGLLEIPTAANGRGLREAGVLPGAGAGYAASELGGRDAAGIAAAAADGELSALYLLRTDPLRDLPGREAWAAALAKATTVVAHAQFLTEGLREHADVVFPAEAYAEKEGTVTHPDGRVQRLRSAIAHPGDVRPEWQVIADVALRAGLDLQVLTGAMASAQLFAAVPFYAGLTLDELGGRGVRWPEREGAADAFADVALGPFTLEEPEPVPEANGRLRLGTFRSIWASEEVLVSPALHFLHPSQRVEMSPDDARRLDVAPGERVRVGGDGTAVTATVTVRAAIPAGSVFLETGVPEDSASALEGPLVEVRKA